MLSRPNLKSIGDPARLTTTSIVLGTLVTFTAGLYFVGADIISSGLDAVSNRAFAQANLLLVFALPVFGAIWVALLLKGQFKIVFGATVISFGLLGKVTRLGGIPAFDNGDGYAQVLALTHAMLFSLAFALVISRITIHQKFPKKVFRALVIFAAIGTISQLFTHDFPDSILLSLGSLWVYVALSYIVLALFSGFDGIRQLAFLIMMSLVFGLILRIATTGHGFFMTDRAGNFYRVDGFAFGPAVSYAGYLAVAAVFAIALVMYESSMVRRVVLAALVIALVTEVASTGTRGAMLSLLLVPVGIAATRRYGLSALMLGALGLVVLVLWSKILVVLEARPIYFDSRITTIPQWLERVELWKINLPHVFDNFGLGYGIGRQLNLALSNGIYSPAHNTFLDLSQQVGAIATFVLIGVIVVIMVRGVKEAWLITAPRSRTLATLALTALFSWLFTANTTSTSLVWFYPVEGTAIFYITLCAVALIKGDTVASNRTVKILERR
jgi:O-antigen ligase